ncbi:Acetyl-CoA C-acetyltransferase [Nocardia seriolae]|uniref:Acetyl-CoA C-acetyltransferase n=2 Tax=Nocardia seriolae TaxID=37332 RepID=A0ABC8B0H4_9NOCA|nr:Acetyl-CoA C-acetyltransferase [Nocardia seriolae]BEK96637.1 acetyl-CoA acetyltransferase [Nocardia seriolae]GAM46666.1 acetyl-CoA acetyltransferase [Nocardia seriolae]GAP28567.1 acetyl-CoA acetyltransferase [Nocardia seriolae]
MSVHIMGGAQTDFAVNWQRAGASFDALVRTVLEEALDAARVAVTDIGVIHVGNAFGQLFTGQGHLGGMPATVHPELWGVPASRHEAACASGSMAALAAMADLESGRYDCALVLGAELEKTVPGAQAAAYMGAAAWAGHETLDTDLVWPTQFAAVADEYDRRYGLDPAHLRAISELNITNARLNPNAQTRDWRYGEAAFTADDAANPPVAGMLRCQDCSQMTDGAAAVVLVSDRFLKRHNDIRVDRTAVITGGGHRTVGLPLDEKFRVSAADQYVFPHVRTAVLDALSRARLADIHQLDGVEVHDCFSMSEYMAIDHLGLTAPGENWKAVESGMIARDGSLPINPGGGLIGIGHPVGATGVRMLLDAYRQVTDQAGEFQLPNARRYGTVNIGGSTTTVASFVVAAADD